MPPTFHLHRDQVDALGGLAGSLLTQVPEYQGFPRELRDKQPVSLDPLATSVAEPADVGR
jgi:hypothetical protein